MKKLALIVALALIMSIFTSCGIRFSDSSDIFKFFDSDFWGSSDIDEKNSEPDQKNQNKDNETADAIDMSLNSAIGEQQNDTVRWITALGAFQMYINGWDWTVFGGGDTNMTQEELSEEIEENWQAYDRESAVDIIEWLVCEGNRIDYIFTTSDMSSLYADEQELEDDMSEILDEEYIAYFLQAYRDSFEYGAHATDGWDYCRAIAVLQWFTHLGYYTENEALEQCYEIAMLAKEQYNSWDEYMESYFRGYEYSQLESSDERREWLEELKASDYNPFEIAWDTELVKTWEETELPKTSKNIIKEYAQYSIPDDWVSCFYLSSEDEYIYSYCEYGTHTDYDSDVVYVDFIESYFLAEDYSTLHDILETAIADGEYPQDTVLSDKMLTDNGLIMYTAEYVLDESYYTDIYIIGDNMTCCISSLSFYDDYKAKAVAEFIANSFKWIENA